MAKLLEYRELPLADLLIDKGQVRTRNISGCNSEIGMGWSAAIKCAEQGADSLFVTEPGSSICYSHY